MINQLFTFSSTIERLRQGPLSEHLDADAAGVAEQGYSHDSIRQQIVAIADFSRWLKQKNIDVHALDSKVVDRFLRLRGRPRRVRRGDPKTLQRLLTMLRQKGVVKPHQPPVTDNAQARIVADFQRYLLQERGLSPLTLLHYVPVMEQFLSERFHNRAPNFAMLRAPDVTGFVMRHARQLSPMRARLMVTALRSFFRYRRHRGAIATDLAACVPTVPNWSLSTLPRFLPTATVERILECCDQTTSVGRRNHAILLLLARLGVRAGEVVGLSLDDITDPSTEVPPLGLLPYRPQRAQPYFYSDHEIRTLLKAAKTRPSIDPLRPWTYRCLFGLLAVTGLRLGEALSLRAGDMDWSEGILTIRGAKFGKSRLVPLHASTCKVLADYAKRRDERFGVRAEGHFLVKLNGNRLDKGEVHRAFYILSRQIGLRAVDASRGPRLHDFRHRFAVETLLRWYRNGEDPKRRLPILSTYLGHAHVTDTYWYLTGTPELLGAAAKRLEKRWEALHAGSR